MKNFFFLDEILRDKNTLEFEIEKNAVPMIYPFLIENGVEIKKRLIENKIFVATYWPNISEWCSTNSFEYYLMQNLLPLPMDQRYDENELNIINKHLKGIYNE